MLFLFPERSCKKKKRQLKELRERAQQILKAFCCLYCRMSPSDTDKLCLLLRRPAQQSTSYRTDVVCCQNECPGKNLSNCRVGALRLSDLRQALLQLYHLLLTKSEVCANTDS